ncbi:MAG: hypothetical protein QXP70_05585 [Methanomassiliicoccales archaeon]
MTLARKAYFSEGNVTPGGTCICSFVFLRLGNHILVGMPTKPELWSQRFGVPPERASEVGGGRYVLPASHLNWFEAPEEAAARVLREQLDLELPASKLKLIEVQSHVSDNPNPERSHWDISFVYLADMPAAAAKKLIAQDWFSGLSFVSPRRLKSGDFLWGHGDVLEKARKKIGKHATRRSAPGRKKSRSPARKAR